MKNHHFSHDLSSVVAEAHPHAVKVQVTVSARVIDRLYENSLEHYQAQAQKPGFPQGATPREYIERNYRDVALKHVEKVALHAFVIEQLLGTMRQHKIVCVGSPRLIQAHVQPHAAAEYTFVCHTVDIPVRNHWKQIHFRSPGRKNYRDIDNQVKLFLAEESEQQATANPHVIQPLDWVSFDVELATKRALESPEVLLCTNVWMKIGIEEADEDARTLFIDKGLSDSFASQARFLCDYFDDSSEIPYQFMVTMRHHVPHAYFCLNKFRHQFKLKSVRDVHRKLIEVFSFRHDISQRREIADAALKALLKEHVFAIPHDLVEVEMALLNEEIHTNPDYYVYKSKEDFKDQLHSLAYKQLKETALIDAISYAEKIEVDAEDIVAYLNLLKRARTREFIYFQLPSTKLREQEFPLNTAIVEQACRREKTLNHIISLLSRA